MVELGTAKQHFQWVRDQIRQLEPDIDEITLADTVEGLTDFHEVLQATIRSALADEAMAKMLKDHVIILERRLDRLAERAARQRNIVRQTMMETNLKKITAPDFTLSLRNGTPALIVQDETAIPNEFWHTPSPRLDRLTLHSHLKAGKPVPGVLLSNPQPVLMVRTS